jgi:hypothetical protein
MIEFPVCRFELVTTTGTTTFNTAVRNEDYALIAQQKMWLLPTWFCCNFILSIFDYWLSGVDFGCRVFLSVLPHLFVDNQQ